MRHFLQFYRAALCKGYQSRDGTKGQAEVDRENFMRFQCILCQSNNIEKVDTENLEQEILTHLGMHHWQTSL